MTATALVLLMTLPALALFYGGLVQAKNILSVLVQCCAVACARFGSVVRAGLQPDLFRQRRLGWAIGAAFLLNGDRAMPSIRAPIFPKASL